MTSEFKITLADVESLYDIPEDDLIGEVLIPAMAVADHVRVGAGFFSSQCLAQIAPGLASFLERSNGTIELLISPSISDADRDALARGVLAPQAAIQMAVDRLLEEASLSQHALVHHTLDCLAYLVASNRLVVRFALMKQGMYHKKLWLLRSGSTWAAVHGSGNATARGLLVNGEQMSVDRPWVDGSTSQARVTKLAARWDSQWANRSPHVLCVELKDGLRVIDGRSTGAAPPSIEDFWRSWHADHARGLEPPLPPGIDVAGPRLLTIPEKVDWRTGKFGHQGHAVDAFLGNGSRGILAIATGGGKTQTALIAAVHEQDRHRGPVLVVIIVPSTPLLRQWAEAVRGFGAEPFQPSAMSGQRRRGLLEEVRAGLSGRDPFTAVILCTQKLFTEDEDMRSFIAELPDEVHAVLVGDEVHNLGSAGFMAKAPHRFNARLGLSATPTRQYNADGTEALFEFFGAPVFEFTLRDAINAGCLTPYNYHVHEVVLTEQEMAEYEDLTRQLQRKGFMAVDDGKDFCHDAQVEHLLRKRRAVLEQAQAKIPALEYLLETGGPENVARTLMYTSAKPVALTGPSQIHLVNGVLRRLGIRFHQYTNTETSSSGAAQYLERFSKGDYQALTAMKVLDEGVDIPHTDTAYLLASSTVRREWIQRRGRILRQSPGKRIAELHDFLVVPPRLDTAAARSVLKGELARVREFAGTAENEYDNDGPREIIAKYETAL
ncbi:DEAD/DEAH box helicase family protein [Streptomyces drozdowiczii]|uniref:DEAD/DEAH box helicase family protein n=1 Tax=Streptomyces drozdowiczii TaxID=202862 RepID=A0ABY6PPE8_9ACTN|nr:DEAD/DEAH box helicase family protein [Streptomyces drozdowiczii]MCX0246567.1 DEAD/DEAH box helicase family protein [Streptomyces drozdowiczii]UZK53951.1 DEAD/DEAH box helicase family protein [Streptomyces drozdowiczii]